MDVDREERRERERERTCGVSEDDVTKILWFKGCRRRPRGLGRGRNAEIYI
jgi:hypothetical protein